MAWYYGTFKCGCEGRVNVTGPTKDRQYKADWQFDTKVCKECYQKEIERQQAEAKAKSDALPTLQGTDKQVVWATTLRIDMIKKIEDGLGNMKKDATVSARFTEASGLNISDVEKALEYMLNHIVDAKFYIDNRDVAIGRVILVIVDMMPIDDNNSDDNNACDNDKSQVMKKAWGMAKEAVQKFGGKIVEYFAQALKKAWQMVKSTHVLPTLAGSEKQVKWASDLRQRFIARISDMEQRMRANEFAKDADEIKQALKYMNEYKTDAKFYIDNRNCNFSHLLNDILHECGLVDAQ